MAHLIFNERQKLLAANLDRASTAALVTGVFAPWGTLATGTGSVTFSAWLLASTGIWTMAGFALHYAARFILGGLRE